MRLFSHMNWTQFLPGNSLSRSFTIQNVPYIAFFWLVIVVTLLSVAIINTFPFYFPDSAGYDGFAADTLRSPVPGELAHLIYGWTGPWSLPIISSAILATVIIRCIFDFQSSISLMAVLIVLILSGTTFFSSVILSDVWIVSAVGSTLALSKRLSLTALMLGAVSVSGHSANFPIIVATAVPIVLYSREKFTLMLRYAIMILLSCFILLVSNYLASGTMFPETFSSSIIASKILNDVPEALFDLCAQKPEGALCDRIEEVREHAHTDSSYFIWASDVGYPTLRQYSWPLAYVAVTRHAYEFLRATFNDFLRAYSPSLGIGVSGYMIRTPTDSYAYRLIDADTGWLSRAGFFNSSMFRRAFYLIHLAFYFGLLALTASAFRSQDRYRGLFLALICAVLANDLVFAAISGMWGRYHFRIVGIVLFALIISCGRKAECRRIAIRHDNSSPTAPPSSSSLRSGVG